MNNMNEELKKNDVVTFTVNYPVDVLLVNKNTEWLTGTTEYKSETWTGVGTETNVKENKISVLYYDTLKDKPVITTINHSYLTKLPINSENTIFNNLFLQLKNLSLTTSHINRVKLLLDINLK